MKRRLAHDNRRDGILSPLRKRFHKLEDEEEDNCDIIEDAEVEGVLDFEPTRFLRCHSRNRTDAADVGTQVWQCAFEPENNEPKKRKLVATCGGNSLCLIDVLTEEVYMKYYSKDIREMFYSLSWSTFPGLGSDVDVNVLAVGGALSTIHLLHPANSTAFLVHKLNKTSKQFIVSLVFSENQPNILFCAMNDAEIMVLDVGSPRPPRYVASISLLPVINAGSELFTLAHLPDAGMLLAGGNEGLYAWRLPQSIDKHMKRPDQIKFHFPQSGSRLVDSLERMEGSVVATKCALHGLIYVWDVLVAMETGKVEGKRCEFDVTPLHVLRWSDTDNYFMNIGYNAGVLACGDDKGRLWVYDVGALAEGKEGEKGAVEPSAVMPWPEVDDQYIALKRKLRLDVYDVVVDKVGVDPEGRYLVAVTANNMVCIWRRTNASKQSDISHLKRSREQSNDELLN